MSRLNESKCPCKDCKDRHIACHSTCKDYKLFAEDRIVMKEKRREEISIDHTISSLAVNRFRRRK